MVKNLVVFFLVLSLSFIGVLSLAHSGFPPTHDGEYHVVRFYQFDEALRSGDVYPRWAADFNNGYGIPLFNFVYPLPNYVASLFHLLSISFIDAFKLSMIAATLLGAVSMYVWSKEYWGSLGGVVSSVLYSFAPYRFVDIYVRGSIGEVWALAFVPLVLWAVTKVLKEKDLRFVPVISVGLALLVFSHNILALLFFGFILTYAIFLMSVLKRYEYIKIMIISFVLGLCLSSVFWLPALWEKQYVRGLEIFSVDRHFVELYQLLIPSWGSGFSGDVGQGMSFQIGIVNILIIILSLIMLVFWNKNRLEKGFIVFSVIWLLALVLLMLPISSSAWKTIPLLPYFQFPWRLLSLVIVLCAFLGGVVGMLRYRFIFSVIVIVTAIFLTISYTKPAYYHDRDDSYYLSRSNFIHGTNSPGDTFNTIWFAPQDKQKEKLTLEGKGTIHVISQEPTRYVADVSLPEPTNLTIHTAYFPGWEMNYKGKSYEPLRTKNGIMSVLLPQGSYRLTIQFTDTIVRRISLYISLGSMFGIFFLTLKYRKHENSH